MATPNPTIDYVEQDAVIGFDTSAVDPMNNPNRKSSLFFRMCDMRTATVALNIINIIFTLIVAIIISTMYAFDQGPNNSRAIFGVIFGAIIISGISILGLYSAMNWNLNGMYASTAGFACVLLYRLIHLDIVDVLVTGVLLYPHIVLTLEMSSGILTPETFEEEEFVAEGGRDFVEMAHTYISPINSPTSQV